MPVALGVLLGPARAPPRSCRAVELHLGAERAHRLDLHRVRLFRHHDDAARAAELRAVGERLAVVAGGRADDPALRAPRRVRLAQRLMPPRTLNAPIGCRFSSLRYASKPNSRDISGLCTSGVGWQVRLPARASRGRRRRASAGGRSCGRRSCRRGRGGQSPRTRSTLGASSSAGSSVRRKPRRS